MSTALPDGALALHGADGRRIVRPAMAPPAHRPAPDIRLRPGRRADLDALVGLERRIFGYDQISRRSFRRFLGSRTASVMIAEHRGTFAGYALVLFRSRSRIAR